MYRRSRFRHTRCSRPWAERQSLVYGFSGGLALRQVGANAPLSPSLGLSPRAETTLLNKFVEISITTGRFCSRCHVVRPGRMPRNGLFAVPMGRRPGFPSGLFPFDGESVSQAAARFPEKKLRTKDAVIFPETRDVIRIATAGAPAMAIRMSR